jgi:hypothetical protein
MTEIYRDFSQLLEADIRYSHYGRRTGVFSVSDAEVCP